jgi:hypothetical protein
VRARIHGIHRGFEGRGVRGRGAAVVIRGLDVAERDKQYL